MNWIDWILFAVPVAIVVAAAVRAQRYVHGVADFLSAGRIARRYVICVASGEAAFGLVSLVGNLEAHYNSGFAYGFWGSVLTPLSMALGLVGYCTYRFRETRAMTLGQFFEMRYSRAFRLTASGIQLLACFVNYPIYLLVVAYLLCRFSWWRDLLPAISARPEGMSFLNPFDTSGLRDFNVFYVVSGILGLFFNRMLWVPSLYPWIATHGWAARLDSLLRALSAPMEPWVHWELTPDKFPISSAEVGVFTSFFTILLYVAVSLATCRKAFDMEKLLHRGKYAIPEGGPNAIKCNRRQSTKPPLLTRIIGIDSNYTRGDKALAWSVFCYSFGWGFCLCFLGNVLWHVLGEMGILPRQPDSWWGVYFFIVNFVVACAVGVVSTFWFGICSTRDLLRLFRDLEERERSGGGLDATDDGRVRD